MKIRNIFVIFLVSGFWHGANWTFIIWGGLNAIYFLPLLLTNNNRKNLGVIAEGKYYPTIKEFFNMGITFLLTVLAWVFFRADNVGHGFRYISGIFSPSLFAMPTTEFGLRGLITVSLILIFVFVEWLGRENQYAIERLDLKLNQIYRLIVYMIITCLIFYFQGPNQEFIYFQF